MMSFTREWPQTHHQLRDHYDAQYTAGVKSGKIQPFIYPWGTFGALVVLLYLLIPHQNRPWLRRARWLVFAWITGFAAYSIKYTRAKDMACAFSIGLMSAWSVIWIGTIMIVNDCQTDFQRIERTEGVFRRSYSDRTQEEERNRDAMNGISANDKSYGGAVVNGTANNTKSHLAPRHRRGEFAWQPYPSAPFIERLDWVADIFCNFRGMGWNWRISSSPPPPKAIQEQLQRNSPNPPQHSTRVRPGQTKLYSTRKELLKANLKTLVKGYLILDALTTFVHHDPYFWGLVSRPPPSYWPTFITSSPVLVQLYRLWVTQLAVQWALQTIFSLAPLFFTGILSPSLIGARAEVWMYPEEWGSYTLVLDRGLAGWWSGWWHQTFQFAFKEPSRKLVEVLGMDPRSAPAKALQLFIAFGLSGALHACGSYTQPGSTRPLLGPLRFFLFQAVGIFIEVLLTQLLKPSGVQKHIPQWAMRTFTFLYVHVWFYFTAPLICDDFAKGGIWLWEPLPFSIFRALGLGVEGDGWWCWGGIAATWVTGDKWWRSGIAL